ncbi:MAG: Asp-tRNA(Asn)/Glu-tRNA(Gln) amidotransferase GatCAB subunit B, partial [Anaerolineales bacterium]|nr:Asp-tRNA(Asn)/Glu-tRNA(Gln) amidotransferase GatCAB subunit B [Anaerolineales bacterium]
LLRFEANVSVRPAGSETLLTRTEIKNLNSLRALERAIAYEIKRQVDLYQRGEPVLQQTMGWDEQRQITFPQRGKEQAEDYRYFPEPDLPPLVVTAGWVAEIRDKLPELPSRRADRFVVQYQLAPEQAEVLTAEPALADYFEAVVASAQPVPATTVAHWLRGELFSWMNQHEIEITALAVGSGQLAELLQAVETGRINANTGKRVLAEMLASGATAEAIIQQQGLEQISDQEKIAALVSQVLQAHPEHLADYQAGKENLLHWFFGQVMKATFGQADPQLVRQELHRQLEQA